MNAARDQRTRRGAGPAPAVPGAAKIAAMSLGAGRTRRSVVERWSGRGATGGGRNGPRRPLEVNHLTVVRDVHVQAVLGDPRQFRATRRVTDVSLEFGTLGFERHTALLKAAFLPRAREAEASSPYDACGHEDETEQEEGDE